MPPDSVELTGQELRQLRDALVEAFPSRAELNQLVTYEFETTLASIIPDNTNLTTAAFDLIQWAQRQGAVERLIAAASREKPGAPKLRAFISSRAAAPVRERRGVSVPDDSLAEPVRAPAAVPDAYVRLMVVSTFCVGSVLVICMLFLLVFFDKAESWLLWGSVIPVGLLAALVFRMTPQRLAASQ